MALNVEALENSFEQIKPSAAEFSGSFYSTLFTDYPETEALFANTDMATQQAKLVQALVLVVENLRNPDTLTQALQGLGARHVQYGILPEHYPMVGGALLKTFAAYLDESWTPDVKQSWVDAYGAITALMLAGADYPESVLRLS